MLCMVLGGLQVATACAATVKAVATKQERLASTLSIAKEGIALADAKCTALGAEIARLYRDHGFRRRLDPEKRHNTPGT